MKTRIRVILPLTSHATCMFNIARCRNEPWRALLWCVHGDISFPVLTMLGTYIDKATSLLATTWDKNHVQEQGNKHKDNMVMVYNHTSIDQGHISWEWTTTCAYKASALDVTRPVATLVRKSEIESSHSKRQHREGNNAQNWYVNTAGYVTSGRRTNVTRIQWCTKNLPYPAENSLVQIMHVRDHWPRNL